MSDYQFTNDGKIQRVSDGVLITSNDPTNADLQQYQAWAATHDPDPSPAQAWANYQNQAREQLNICNDVLADCEKKNTTYPAEWLAFYNALLSIVNAPSGDPTQIFPQTPATPQ